MKSLHHLALLSQSDHDNVLFFQITTSLHMKNVSMIQRHPQRGNIALEVVKVTNTITSGAFRWLADQIREKGQCMDRVIVYCRLVFFTVHILITKNYF